jgi:hypothetical protein
MITCKSVKDRQYNGTEKKELVLFLLAIVLSVLLRYMDSDYPFGIFKFFFCRVSVAQPLHFCIVVCRSLFCLLFLFFCSITDVVLIKSHVLQMVNPWSLLQRKLWLKGKNVIVTPNLRHVVISIQTFNRYMVRG